MDGIARLAEMGLKELQAEWEQSRGDAPPPVASAEFLRNLLAWELQAKWLGSLCPKTKRKLEKLALEYDRNPDYRPTAVINLRPGVVLTREWQGKPHRVRVLDKGFEYRDQRYRSLSQVARAITGTQWSGPLFFGLRESCR